MLQVDNNILGIVAAGGYSSRMNSMIPKSMLAVQGITLLELSLIGLLCAGVKRIIVFSDRIDYCEQQYNIVAKYRGVKLFRDEGVKSTIELLNMAREISCSSKYIFCYGHAPRPDRIFSDLVKCNRPLGGVIVKSSSRRDFIQYNAAFIEPPFFIYEDYLSLFDLYRKWSELFINYPVDIYGIHENGPPEFNDQIGWYYFRQYVSKHVIQDHERNNPLNSDRQLCCPAFTAG